ncbi:hypothetical protein EP073_08260 [Geovibrio thiophilus]|uniref:Response regulatory domain-containing protein n=1 Tax=Geovibrio thiophilus TaxID=139438 RepID=A0A3R5UV35_9BACT|nr:hypothetical protein [Geovibrio thiophilus]QAR33392.1 hypothetical protein EP073_08260 [Geovibrio thiophilus]
MVAETRFENISLLYFCEGEYISEEFILSIKNRIKRLTIGRNLSDMSSILDNIDVDVLLLDIDPGRIPAEVLNAFLIKMKSKKEDLSVIIVTKPSEFADNLTEADFVVSRDINPEQLKRLVELC